MLTRLRFKNWRSLRDVEITDLTPITVFIGANASGKTNTVDALRFINYVSSPGHSGVVGGVRKWRGREKIRTASAGEEESVVLEYSFCPNGGQEIKREMEIKFEGRDVPLIYRGELFEGTHPVDKYGPWKLPLEGAKSGGAFTADEAFMRRRSMLLNYEAIYVARRWQLLDELFNPPLSISYEEAEPGDLYILDQSGRNLPYILENMQQTQPDLYVALQDDLRWLLEYVDTVGIEQGEHETRLFITENPLDKSEAPSISAGTARLVAMLTAFYVLDMERELVDPDPRTEPGFEGLNIPIAHMPGLVIIEEPDTALNPALLGRFVELLRTYVSGEHPRQVILTTHNPALLNFFKPEEVRVVERDENGHTTVKRIPEHVEKIWLDDYGLGEVWLTNSFGGLAI
jgi:predicted ATPase